MQGTSAAAHTCTVSKKEHLNTSISFPVAKPGTSTPAYQPSHPSFAVAATAAGSLLWSLPAAPVSFLPAWRLWQKPLHAHQHILVKIMQGYYICRSGVHDQPSDLPTLGFRTALLQEVLGCVLLHQVNWGLTKHEFMVQWYSLHCEKDTGAALMLLRRNPLTSIAQSKLPQKPTQSSPLLLLLLLLNPVALCAFLEQAVTLQLSSCTSNHKSVPKDPQAIYSNCLDISTPSCSLCYP
jgi:hypothetical protein